MISGIFILKKILEIKKLGKKVAVVVGIIESDMNMTTENKIRVAEHIKHLHAYLGQLWKQDNIETSNVNQGNVNQTFSAQRNHGNTSNNE